jgi:hypothetical protein
MTAARLFFLPAFAIGRHGDHQLNHWVKHAAPSPATSRRGAFAMIQPKLSQYCRSLQDGGFHCSMRAGLLRLRQHRCWSRVHSLPCRGR